MREKLIDRMISIYGMENPIVIEFCEMCEHQIGSKDWDDTLTMLVEIHEDEPYFGEDE